MDQRIASFLYLIMVKMVMVVFTIMSILVYV